MTGELGVAAEVRSRLEEGESAVTEFLSESLRIPSVTGDEGAYAEFLERWARTRGWQVERLRLDDPELAGLAGLENEENPKGRWNLLLRPWPRSARPLLVVNGHLDVVPPGEPESWTGGAFDGRTEDGWVHGRGAVDTKGPIAAALLGVCALAEMHRRPAVDVEFHLVLGEERSGIGTRAALESWQSPDGVVVLEPSGSLLVSASTGLIAFEVVVHGISAHTSKPWEGRDALLHLLRIHESLSRREAEKNAAARSGDFAEVPIPAPFVIGTIEAGRFRNAVPDRAAMVGRLGLLPGESPQDAASALTALVQRIDEEAGWLSATEVTVFHGLAGWRTDQRDPLVAAMRSAVESLGRDGEPRVLTAGSDAGYYGELGIPTVLFGPGEMALAHSPDERIEVTEVIASAAIIAGTVAAMPGGAARESPRASKEPGS
ncbi:MAG: M20 family metallopeptidase [Leucobacter sp.]